MSISDNESWFDHTYICVSAESGSEIQLRSKTTSLNITGGNFDVESSETFGGSIKRYGQREDFEITLEAIPVSLQDFDWMFHGVSNTATEITSSSVSDYRLTFLWTDQTGVTDAAESIDTSSEAYREIYAECNMVSCEKSQSVGEDLKATVTFKTSFEDKDGSINFKKEMCDTSSALSAVSAYTSTTKY